MLYRAPESARSFFLLDRAGSATLEITTFTYVFYHRTGRAPMTGDRFSRALKDRRQISISVIGRRSGRTITKPVWFVLAGDALWLLPVYGARTQWYRNLLMNPAITIKARGERLALRSRMLEGAQADRKVIRWF